MWKVTKSQMVRLKIPTVIQGWANRKKLSANPENTDNYFWEIYAIPSIFAILSVGF